MEREFSPASRQEDPPRRLTKEEQRNLAEVARAARKYAQGVRPESKPSSKEMPPPQVYDASAEMNDQDDNHDSQEAA